jgi:hypothetical protein
MVGDSCWSTVDGVRSGSVSKFRGPSQSQRGLLGRKYELTVLPSYAIQFGTMIEAIVMPEAAQSSVMARW